MTIFSIFAILIPIIFGFITLAYIILAYMGTPKEKRRTSTGEWKPVSEGVNVALALTMMYTIIVGLILLLGSEIAESFTPNRTIQNERPLSALNLTSRAEGSVSGGLFLTVGTLDSQDYYVVATVDVNGFSKIEKLPTDSVVYKETDTEVPRVVETYVIKDTTQGVGKFWKVSEGEPHKTYTIYVPQGSVSNTINIDLKDI